MNKTDFGLTLVPSVSLQDSLAVALEIVRPQTKGKRQKLEKFEFRSLKNDSFFVEWKRNIWSKNSLSLLSVFLILLYVSIQLILQIFRRKKTLFIKLIDGLKIGPMLENSNLI